MPGQGFHLGFSKLAAEKAKKEFTDEMKVGTLIVDALSHLAGARRFSHFTGGAGCVLPQFNELQNLSSIQTWDSGMEKSFIVDPKIDIMLMKTASKHLTSTDYRNGILLHLLADNVSDNMFKNEIFDFSNQENGFVSIRNTCIELDKLIFRKLINSFYPMLDQYVMQLAGIDEKYIEETKKLLHSTVSPELAKYICQYLNFDPNIVIEDNDFFTIEMIDNLLEKNLFFTAMHII